MSADSILEAGEVCVRPAVDADARAIQQIIRLAFAEYPGCVFDLTELPELLRPATAFAALGGLLWVAEQGASVVGSVGLTSEDKADLFQLRKLYLDARVRGRGLGRRLIETAEAAARKRAGTAIHLWTDTRFCAAHRVYERLGYTRLRETRTLADRSHSIEFHYHKTL